MNSFGICGFLFVYDFVHMRGSLRFVEDSFEDFYERDSCIFALSSSMTLRNGIFS